MKIYIDIESKTPIFAQLVTQIKQAVINQNLLPLSPLPSIRQLAADLEVNKKTVAKAYQTLERDNVIQTKGYRGTFIHPEAVKNSAFDINIWMQESLSETIKALRNKGATNSEIRIAFTTIMNSKK